MRNPMTRCKANDDMAVGYEIKSQDLVGKSGAGVFTAIILILIWLRTRSGFGIFLRGGRSHRRIHLKSFLCR